MEALQSGDLPSARKLFERVVQLAPKSAPAHNSLGWVLAAQGSLEEAVQHYHLALKLDPDFVLAHLNLASALAGRGDFEDGVSDPPATGFCRGAHDISLGTPTTRRCGRCCRGIPSGDGDCETKNGRAGGAVCHELREAAFSTPATLKERSVSCKPQSALRRTMHRPIIGWGWR